jgi:SpoVK/Ycf46/Vps4 family AAA+-type ATPase
MPLDGVDLDALAGRTRGFAGADLKALCQQAALLAMVRTRSEGAPAGKVAVTTADFDTRSEGAPAGKVAVTTADFDAAIAALERNGDAHRQSQEGQYL